MKLRKIVRAVGLISTFAAGFILSRGIRTGNLWMIIGGVVLLAIGLFLYVVIPYSQEQ